MAADVAPETGENREGVDPEPVETTIEDEASVDEAEGVEGSRIHEMAMETDAPVRDITLVADDFDATVLGERAPTLGELLFGEFDERMIAESLGPVVVVRRAEEVEP